MLLPLRRYADFQGRSRRSEYWLWVLFKFLLGAGLTLLGGLVGLSGSIMGVGIFVLLRFAMFCVIVVPDMAVSVRRMHDINRSGWWILFPYAVTLVASIIYLTIAGGSFIAEVQSFVALSQTADPQLFINGLIALMASMLWVFVPALLAKIVTLVFRCTPGTHGPNRFGADPRDPANIGVF